MGRKLRYWNNKDVSQRWGRALKKEDGGGEGLEGGADAAGGCGEAGAGGEGARGVK